MNEQTKTDEYVYLKIPAEAWALLRETLVVDARASNFDRSLRSHLIQALSQVETLDTPPLDLSHVFVFLGDSAVTAVTDRNGKNLGEEIVEIDFDQEDSCPVCSTELEPDEACCPNCGLDTDADTNENAIKAYFGELGGPLPPETE